LHAQSPHTRAPRLRADAGGDGGVREKLAAEVKGAARPAGGSIQNGPRRLKQIKALHWQTPARGSFDHQRLFGALANRITLKTPMVSARNGNKRRQWAAMI